MSTFQRSSFAWPYRIVGNRVWDLSKSWITRIFHIHLGLDVVYAWWRNLNKTLGFISEVCNTRANLAFAPIYVGVRDQGISFCYRFRPSILVHPVDGRAFWAHRSSLRCSPFCNVCFKIRSSLSSIWFVQFSRTLWNKIWMILHFIAKKLMKFRH